MPVCEDHEKATKFHQEYGANIPRLNKWKKYVLQKILYTYNNRTTNDIIIKLFFSKATPSLS
jgi:hypothetical protein